MCCLFAIVQPIRFFYRGGTLAWLKLDTRFESSETSDKPSNWQLLNNTIFHTENFTDVLFFVIEYFNHRRSIIVMKSRVVVVRHQRMFTSRGPEAP